MLTTSEIRWFSRGVVPPVIENWFTKDVLREICQPLEKREDWYLLIPGCEFLGVKLRQHRLETKLRVTGLGIWKFRNNAIGAAEKWIKSSCEDAKLENLLTPDIIVQGQWVKVEKVRSQIRYLVSDDYSLTPASTENTLQNGCNIELTQLIINHHDWWTLGFEASGTDENLITNLEVVAKKMFQTFPDRELNLVDSYAYPKWLSVFV
ncbi:hypothetical protein NIES2119_11110 [[Phormidium ambiguum] IAM M-71]|uniref:CYTH domain-containing protein n=1 Tax=[Phormidium ambiguum] IAM M-71 TaxID=454136 RepID=A0A1U7ILG8_9CYAN|nr:hypothetical protein [Phormidium ambiguum]OKH38101.1 hypothetical protein NIES2119_11110 [Phormidium ambiguum IAM M-71]